MACNATCTGADQRTACRSEFSPATMWILRMELKSSAMVAETSTHWAILLASETKDLRFRFQDSPGSNSRLDWFSIEIDTNRGTHALSCLPPRLTQDWLDSPSFFLSLCLQLLYVSLLCLCCALGDGRTEIATSIARPALCNMKLLIFSLVISYKNSRT